MKNIRKIIHIDMDAFYASVEQRDHPEMRGKPVAVGGSRHRGVVAAASYEARKFGIHSAMPSITAYRKCPDLIFARPRFDVYKDISHQIRDIFRSYTDKVEPLSLDEAYLDVTENLVNNPSATRIAQEIRARIREETQLTASAGVSFNKFLAKVGSDYNKPNGITVVTPDLAPEFLQKLPIGKFHGIGKVTAARMINMGIKTGADLLRLEKEDLKAKFGKTGGWYYHIVRGEDSREVSSHRIRKSLGAERTFDEDIADPDFMFVELKKIVGITWKRLDKAQTTGRTVTLKIKYYNFVQTTRSITLPQLVTTEEQLMEAVRNLLHTPELPPEPVRLLGVTLSNLSTDEDEEERQLAFGL